MTCMEKHPDVWRETLKSVPSDLRYVQAHFKDSHKPMDRPAN